MTLPITRLSGPSRFLIAVAVMFLLGACLSDGPTQTGLGYLQNQGIQLTTPLRHLIFSHFPVDSDYTTELPQNHYGEVRLLVGRDGPFTAIARMGFQITTAAQHDSIAKGLNLQLGVLPTTDIGYSFLQTSTAGHDSLTLQIESFAWNDTTGTFADSLPVYDKRLISTYTPFSTLDPRYIVWDTIRIALAKCYGDSLLRDTLQVSALNNLRARLMTDTAHNWITYLEASPVNRFPLPDSGMFRFVGQGTASNDPGLLLGTYVPGGGTNNPALLTPYVSGSVTAVNYHVTHTDAYYPWSGKTLLYGVSRGLNFRLNRDTLLNRIRDSLGSAFPASATGKYDTRFFVPYAVIHFPLAESLSRVDGPFALDMQLISDVDSQAIQSTGLVSIPVGDSLKLVSMQTPGYGSISTDTLTCRYLMQPVFGTSLLDSSQRRLVVYWASSPTLQDTFPLIPDNMRQEITLRRHNGWSHVGTLGIYPGDSSASVEVYFNIGSGVQPNGFDSAGLALTAFSSLAKRYWRPGSDTLNVRATLGVGALLNRSTGVVNNLFLKPVDHNAFDTTHVIDPTTLDSTSFQLVSFPVLGEIGFPRDATGRLYVTLEVYLYPLGTGK